MLVTFAATVTQLPFYGCRIIWVDFGCFCWDGFCMPLIIAAVIRFCLGLNLLVVTKAVVLVVFLLLICSSFTACFLAGSISIRC